MIQGIYTTSHGMIQLMEKQDQIANNLANVNTTGYKESNLFTKTYQKYLADSEQRPGVNREIKPDQTYINYAEGTMMKTDGALDCCVRGSGFFTILTPNGLGYTRNGNFSLDSQGYLVTNDGSRVMGEEGYIKLDTGKPVLFGNQGEVIQGTEKMGQLRITDFKKPYELLREGNGLFVPKGPEVATVKSTDFAVKQGFLEGSNVNIIRTMTQMIAAARSFDADQRAIVAQDETLEKAVNVVGKVG